MPAGYALTGAVSEATPETRFTVASVVPLELKVTEPVGVPPVVAATVALSVTVPLPATGFGVAVRPVVVAYFSETLPVPLDVPTSVLPLYCALTE